MSPDRHDLDYTRVTDDAAILCRRKDFPRAVNVLQRRAPDRRRWRFAFRRVVSEGDQTLDGARRQWFEAALREVVANVSDRRLAGELVIDAAGVQSRLDLGPALPLWSARDLWFHAEALDLPMEYLAQVTALPSSIRAPIDTARVIWDCRRTAEAHRAVANELSTALPSAALVEEAQGRVDPASFESLAEVRAHHEAARRWRELAHRLFA